MKYEVPSPQAAAMQILLNCGIARLPVDIDTICEKLGICVLSYDDGAEVIERAHLYRAVRDTNGLTFYLGNTPVILFNERRELKQTLFTVAHELGHIVLKHVNPGDMTPAHQGADWNATPKETAANQFAARLLAPACVLRGLNIHTTEETMELCQIPRQAAEHSARLSMQRVFLIDQTEWAVCRQFHSYMDRVRGTKAAAGRNDSKHQHKAQPLIGALAPLET